MTKWDNWRKYFLSGRGDRVARAHGARFRDTTARDSQPYEGATGAARDSDLARTAQEDARILVVQPCTALFY